MKVTLGFMLLVLLSAAGYLLWQQFVGKVPQAVAADQQPLPDFAETATEDLTVSAGLEDKLQPLATEQEPASTQAEVEQNVLAEQVVAEPTTATTVIEAATNQPATVPTTGRNLPEGFSRIVLAATMEQLEPGAAIDTLVAQQQIQRLYLFTELKGYAGQQLIHRWSFAGQVQTEALLTIEDSPWRTYSEKWLLPDQLGSWRVEIVDQQQNVLYQHDFQYQ